MRRGGEDVRTVWVEHEGAHLLLCGGIFNSFDDAVHVLMRFVAKRAVEDGGEDGLDLDGKFPGWDEAEGGEARKCRAALNVALHNREGISQGLAGPCFCREQRGFVLCDGSPRLCLDFGWHVNVHVCQRAR